MVPADYVCCGSGKPCDESLPGPPLMSPSSDYVSSEVPWRRSCQDHSLRVFEWTTPGLHVVEEPEFHDFNVASDSGAADHAAGSSQAPGYNVFEGSRSQAGGWFVAANWDFIPNKGEMTLEC